MKNKLAYMKSTRQNFRESVSYMNNLGQAKYVDSYNEMEKRGWNIPFTHNWNLLSHMHHLRLWTITYAPSTTGNLQRL